MPHDKVNITDLLADSGSVSPVYLTSTGEAGLKTMKLHGEYDFHSHDVDEIFVVLDGNLEMDFENRGTFALNKGDMLKVPAGQRHRTRTSSPANVLLIGPK